MPSPAPEESPQPPRGGAAAAQVLEASVGRLTQAAMSRMSDGFPWFRALPAQERSWIGLIASAGIAGFVEWFRDPTSRPALTAEVFGTAPLDLAGQVSLQQTVEMVRTTIAVVEEDAERLVGADDARQVRESVLRYSREIAFAAADVYARAAEQRGAWDARLEALIVDSVIRGEADDEVRSRATALGWASASGVCVVLGHAPPGDSATAVDAVKRSARGFGLDALGAVQGDRLVVVLGGVSDTDRAGSRVADRFGPGPVVTGPLVDDLHAAYGSARAALAGLRAAAAWPGAPRPVSAEDLLPERVLAGDADARARLVETAYRPLQTSAPLLQTLDAYLAHRGSVEATARALFVHPNTVRYRLRRIAEVTGHSPADAREAYTLQVALALGRLGL